jgi:hypothetical protein
MARLGDVAVVGHLRGVEDGSMPALVVVRVDPSRPPPYWFEPATAGDRP